MWEDTTYYSLPAIHSGIPRPALKVLWKSIQNSNLFDVDPTKTVAIDWGWTRWSTPSIEIKTEKKTNADPFTGPGANIQDQPRPRVEISRVLKKELIDVDPTKRRFEDEFYMWLRLLETMPILTRPKVKDVLLVERTYGAMRTGDWDDVGKFLTDVYEDND
jgi:hypothetical protein